MAKIDVRFNYLTGIKTDIFRQARLLGSWGADGKYSDQWTSVPMEKEIKEDGCPGFRATISLDSTEVGKEFHWGVEIDGSDFNNQWGIPTEINDQKITDCYRTFTLKVPPVGPPPINQQEERYYLTHCRRLGANKRIDANGQVSLKFAVWAPNAARAEVVFGRRDNGYISDDGYSILESLDYPVIPLFLKEDGVWESDANMTPLLRNYQHFDHMPYMFRLMKKNGSIVYRTDLYSRCQIGAGNWDPRGDIYTGATENLDGSKSCSVVVDPETVTRHFSEPVWPETEFIPEEEFWANEFPNEDNLPKRVEDMVIYEMQVGALWNSRGVPGDLEDAIHMLDYLKELGVNTIELLPMNEFEGWARWGYGSSHFFAIEYSSGGRDQFKHFVRECHQRGLAVILDVVYNHYEQDADRAEWMYDSDQHEENIYYWYEGQTSDYKDPFGGYLDNWSTGYAPRYYDEMVRKMFVSSAVALAMEFHVDGFRFDQTTSIHAYNVLHADGTPMGNANMFGAKFLRELTRTLKLVKPSIILTAEDHSNWNKVTMPTSEGGLGFDSTWYADFYHQLIGDQSNGPEYAKLLYLAGDGNNQPLAMDYFAGTLENSAHRKVVYHECHDEAGNAAFTHRTIVVAVREAPLVGETRKYAEARCRFVFGMSMLSPGTPLFLMGEEVGASKDYKYNTFLYNRENLMTEKENGGHHLFKFYGDLIRLRLTYSPIRSHNIENLHVHNENRVVIFRRWENGNEFLCVASLNNQPFLNGYNFQHPHLNNGNWQEVFNSDSEIYGGYNIGNNGRVVTATNHSMNVVIPANGFVVFNRISP